MIKEKILKHWPTLEKIKELEAKLKEEKVYKENIWSSTITYKGDEYIDIRSSNDMVEAARNRQKKDAELKLNEQSENIQKLETSLFAKDQEIKNLTEALDEALDKLTKEAIATLAAKKELQEESEKALERERELRKDLIETIKLNTALNSRTVETKTVAREPITIKPVKKKK